jgi:hypothetical protein
MTPTGRSVRCFFKLTDYRAASVLEAGAANVLSGSDRAESVWEAEISWRIVG